MVVWLSSYARRALAALVLGWVAVTVACSSSTSGADAVGPQLDPAPGEDVDASYDDASNVDAGSAPPPTGSFRIAHLAADVGAVDVCYRTSSTAAFIGPLVTRQEPDAGAKLDAGAKKDGGDADASDPDAGAAGLSFPSVSAYFAVPVADDVEVAIVSATDRSCAAPRARGHVAIGLGSHVTMAYLGLSSADAGAINELGITAFEDDPRVDADNARARFVNAALGTLKVPPSDALAITVSTSKGEVTVAPRVDPRHATTPSSPPNPVDALGYGTLPLITYGSFICRHLGDAGGSWASVALPVAMAGGSVHTGFVVSDTKSGFAIVWCDDIASSCTVAR